jgi:hypothetical protein
MAKGQQRVKGKQRMQDELQGPMQDATKLRYRR